MFVMFRFFFQDSSSNFVYMEHRFVDIFFHSAALVVSCTEKHLACTAVNVWG